MDDKTPKEIDEYEDVDLETSSVNKALQSLSSQQSAIDKAMAAMVRPVLVKPKWTLLIDNFHTQLGSCHH